MTGLLWLIAGHAITNAAKDFLKCIQGSLIVGGSFKFLVKLNQRGGYGGGGIDFGDKNLLLRHKPHLLSGKNSGTGTF